MECSGLKQVGSPSTHSCSPGIALWQELLIGGRKKLQFSKKGDRGEKGVRNKQT